MANKGNLEGVYFVKNKEGEEYIDVTSFDGVRVLSVEGFAEKGKPINIYTAQWIDSQKEDFMVASQDGKVVRENVDISVTFIVGQRYAKTQIDVLQSHEKFVEYLTSSDVWIRSSYASNKVVHCVCLQSYKPTTIKLQRGDNSFILGTITLHALEEVSD